MEVTELGASPGRLTMYFEVVLGVEVRPRRYSPWALAQQQCSGFLGQAAPVCILHQPALYHRASSRNGGHQAWGRGVRVRRRLRTPVTRNPPPSPRQRRTRDRVTSLHFSPVLFQGRVAEFAHPKPERGAGTEASWRCDLLSPERSLFFPLSLSLSSRGQQEGPQKSPLWLGEGA